MRILLSLVVWLLLVVLGSSLLVLGSANARSVAVTPPIAQQEYSEPMANGCVSNARLTTTPNRSGFNELIAIDAVAANDLWAVGLYYSPTTDVYQTMLLHGDGTEWSHVPSPDPTWNKVKAITAVSSSDVWAVGEVRGKTLTMHWNGAQWAVVPSPNAGTEFDQNVLSGVAAISSNNVWAVGSYKERDYPFYERALIQHWNGSQWTIAPGPDPGDTNASLRAIDAISATDIWAVGARRNYYYGADSFTLHWDGIAWTEIPNAGRGDLVSVSGAASNDVWAVGADNYYYVEKLSIMHWDGHAWSVISVPNPSKKLTARLSGVVAISAGDAWAVGSSGTNYSGDGSELEELALHWNGSAWATVPNLGQGKLSGVDALSGGNVWAVGSTGVPISTLVEQWDGTRWNQRSSPNPGPATNFLTGVDGVSSNDVWAVGNYDTIFGPDFVRRKTLIEHWDGTQWSIVPSPNSPTYDNALVDVAAISTDDVWAVGTLGHGFDHYDSLFQHWDGTQWSIVPSPLVQSKYEELPSLGAVSANDVWAVGYSYSDFAPRRTLIEHWNGTAWTVIPSPNSRGDSALYDVTAISANDAWAVGHATDGEFPSRQPLILRWNGDQWNVVPIPVFIGNYELNAVTAVSANDVWAVGQSLGYPENQTLTMHWNGTAWSVVPSPSVNGVYSYFSSISAVSTNDVWAAGTYNSSGAAGPLLMHWDGANWSFKGSDTPGGLTNRFSDIVAFSATDLWAVGDFSTGVPNRTMAQHIGRFSDAALGDYFYGPVNWLVSRGAVSGYSDCTFRPQNNTTRAQLTKIVTLAKGWTMVNPVRTTFTDVSRNNYFFPFVETAFAHGIIGGYPCGNPEPCDELTRPYFRPNAAVTRGQLAQIIVQAQGWPLLDPANPTFADVARGTTFYRHIETARTHGILGGYACGSPEPCNPQNQPYFRPGNSATRGQIAKIVYNAVTSP